MKTEKQLWAIVKKAKWKLDHDDERIKAEWSKLDEDIFKQLEKFINEKAFTLSREYEGAWLGKDGKGGFDVSDDGWMDLTADVVGRGKTFYNSITAEKLRTMADENDYKECFLYCLH